MNNLDRRKHIVVVDDNPVNLEMAENVLKDHYKITKLISGEQLLKFLERVEPDLVLLDIQMPGLDGFQTLERLDDIPVVRDIPVIILTGKKDVSSEREGFRLGAKDFITKPFDNTIMLARIHSQLELYQYRTELEEIIRKKTSRIEDLQHIITVSWAEMIESRDGTTGSHVRNTTRYFEVLLQLMAAMPAYKKDFPEDSISDLLRASAMHDIGKISISDQVLKKPGALTVEEFEHMKQHSRIGADMIQKVIDSGHQDDFLHYARAMALYHHERWNGTGYPVGLRGEEIPLYVRVLSVADVYDALTSVRPYKKAFGHDEAYEIMGRDRGVFFCPEIFDIFLAYKGEMRAALESKHE